MKERPQVNIRLDQDLLDDINELADAEHVDRSEIARRLLNVGLSNYRMGTALRDYRRGAVSAWKAADMAGVSLYEMLDRIHVEGIPHELDPDVLDRLDARARTSPAAREEPARYASPVADDASGIADLREQFRPVKVTILFVGESSPAGGTHFYLANSNLFRATQAAFAAAYGDEKVPNGPRFVRWFQEEGCWLVDLADRPVNRLSDTERAAAVDEGVDRLARVIRETKPARLMVVKSSIAGNVRRAAELADFVGAIVELPFPVRQWRAKYTAQLAAALREGGSARGLR